MRTCVRVGIRGATILHADLDAFYASVEQRDDPRLRGRPVIVGGGVVLACSYEAKAYGVRTAMGGGRRCAAVPGRDRGRPADVGVLRGQQGGVRGVPGHHAAGRGAVDRRGVPGRRRVAADLAGRPLEIAAAAAAPRCCRRVGLPITVGVARTKFLAKVASGVAKPDGLLVVPPDRELEFLHPLPVERLWGVGEVTAEKLREPRASPRSARSPSCGEAALVAMLGRGVRAAPARAGAQPRSRGRSRSAGAGGRSARSARSAVAARRRPTLDAVLAGLVDRVTRRMRAAGRSGRTVMLRLRFDDFTRATRSHTLPQATAQTQTILITARALLAAARPLIASAGSRWSASRSATWTNEAALQLALPFDKAANDELDARAGSVRDSFGTNAITRGVLLGRDQGLTVPMLPD